MRHVGNEMRLRLEHEIDWGAFARTGTRHRGSVPLSHRHDPFAGDPSGVQLETAVVRGLRRRRRSRFRWILESLANEDDRGAGHGSAARIEDRAVQRGVVLNGEDELFRPILRSHRDSRDRGRLVAGSFRTDEHDPFRQTRQRKRA
jgi:hypothetical protein